MDKRVVLITGASSGIGEATAIALNKAGFKVYGSARSTEKMSHLVPLGISVLALDITDEASIVNCVNEVIKIEGKIDVLINNAGYGSYGAVEDVPLEEAKKQFEVNIFGLARITQLVLPSMRANKYGKIVNISSMGGKMYTPFGAWYHATKYALEGWSDCLRLETKPFGIDVILIEPGAIKTPWGTIAANNLRQTSEKGAYTKMASKTASGLEKRYNSNQPSDPKVIADVILKAVKSSKPKTRYAKGYMAKFSIFFRKWFGDRIFDKVITTMV